MPNSGPRLPIQLTDVPLNVKVACPPAVLESQARPVRFADVPLQSPFTNGSRQSAVCVRAWSWSSNRDRTSSPSTTTEVPVEAAFLSPVTSMVMVWRPGVRFMAVNTTVSSSMDAYVSTWAWKDPYHDRSEEHTSELQSHSDLVCRLLLEKKKINRHIMNI